MKKIISFAALLLAVVLLSNCKKEKAPDVTGFYLGATRTVQTSFTPPDNYSNSDVTLDETIEVRLLPPDSIAIGDKHFLYNDLYQYFLQQGTQYAYTARFNTQEDSLIIQIYEYAAQGAGFTQSDIEFKGKKQD